MLNGINERFGLDSQLQFALHPSGLIQGTVSTDLCGGQFYLHGAHVAYYAPAGARSLLFMSRHSEMCEDKPIRGGVPLCFPWFGPHPNDAAAPAHGLVRTRNWQLQATSLEADGVVRVALGLTVDRWQLTYTIRWGASLDLNLAIENLDDQPRECEVALHTYLALADVHTASVSGLEQQSHLDKLTGATEPASGQAIRFTQETDRVYHGAVSEVLIDDPGHHRKIRLLPRNSRSTVVWNPWIAKSHRMNDFGDDEYLHMCCVETANVGRDCLQIPAHATDSLGCVLDCI
jgi:glucose-6-phosphate 1-epimerase